MKFLNCAATVSRNKRISPIQRKSLPSRSKQYCYPAYRDDKAGYRLSIETLKTNTQDLAEQQSLSFDLLASVRMAQFDLITSGKVLPETLQRIYDEELTYIAEAIDRPISTEFTLQKANNDLVFFDRGEWRPYVGTLVSGVRAATQEAQNDYRKSFLVERAQSDLSIGYKMSALKPGEHLAWFSDYPYEQEKQYGKEFLRSQGFQPERRMGFLYLATGNIDGSVTLQSQSVDNADPEAFDAAMQSNGSMRIMLQNYDRVVEAKLGLEVYAGRAGGERYNAWTEIQKHRDLLDYYFEQLLSLAKLNLNEREMLQAKQKLTYGVWGALKKRLRNGAVPQVLHNGFQPTNNVFVYNEVEAAFRQLNAEGVVMAGCGGAIAFGQDGSMQSAFETIFSGGEKGSEAWAWKNGVCRVEKCPSRPKTTQVGPCSICKRCQQIFDTGKDPTKG